MNVIVYLRFIWGIDKYIDFIKKSINKRNPLIVAYVGCDEFGDNDYKTAYGSIKVKYGKIGVSFMDDEYEMCFIPLIKGNKGKGNMYVFSTPHKDDIDEKDYEKTIEQVNKDIDLLKELCKLQYHINKMSKEEYEKMSVENKEWISNNLSIEPKTV
jgi:hypothetical protein